VECAVATGDLDVRALVNESITQSDEAQDGGKLILRKELKNGKRKAN
jgi:hypothetical protein